MSVTPLADTYGRVAGASEANYGEVDPGEMRTCVFDALPKAFWAKKAGIWGGRKTTLSPSVRNVVYRDTGDPGPDNLLAYTNSYQPTAQEVPGTDPEPTMANPNPTPVPATGGAAQEFDFQKVNSGPSTTALLLKAGWKPAIGAIVQDATFAHSRRAAANIHADDENFYERSGLGSLTPPSDYGSFTTLGAGHMTAWIRGEWNEAPQVPVNRVPSGTVQTQTPIFEADFRDNNGAWGTSNATGIDRGDKCQAVKIWVRDAVTKDQIWSDRHTCSRDEQEANHWIIDTIPAVARGSDIEWQCQQQDMGDEWSDLSSWLSVHIATAGIVTTDGSPTGVIDTITPSFQGRWNHVSALGMTQCQVLILRDNSLVSTSPVINKVVASSAFPGTLFTLTWADCDFAANGTPKLVNLEWGQDDYNFLILGKDSAGNWSDPSAPMRPFDTNSPPTVPSLRAPDSGAQFTTYPLIQYRFSDANDDPGDCSLTIEFTRPNLSTVTATASFNSGTGLWEFQTSSTHLNAFGTYLVRARSYDGVTYSGGATVSGNAKWSKYETFDFLTGPAITIDAPVDNGAVLTSGTRVQWTTVQQDKYQVWIYKAGRVNPVYDSTLTVSGNRFHDVPSGLWRDGDLLYAVVEITNSLAQVGRSDRRYFLIDYPPASEIQVLDCRPYRFADDPWDTAVRLTISGTNLTDTFAGYFIYRRETDDPDDDLLIAQIDDPAKTTFIDPHAPIGVELTYSVAQGQTVAGSNNEVTLSNLNFGYSFIEIDGVVLVSVQDPQRRIILDSVQEMADTQTLDEYVHQPLSQRAPTTVRKRHHYWQTQLEASLYDRTPDGGPPAKVRYDQMLRALRIDPKTLLNRETQAFAGGGTFSYRNERQIRRWVVIGPRVGVRPKRVQNYDVTLPLREEDFTEGVHITLVSPEDS